MKKEIQTIYFATDHAGYEMKERLVPYVNKQFPEVEVNDEGAFEYNEKDDYPDFIKKAAQKVSENPDTARGIILGHSGQGEAMVANRFENVRAAVYYGKEEEIVKLSREHNDANILSLGAGFLTPEEAKRSVNLWLETEFSDAERHTRRIDKIDNEN